MKNQSLVTQFEDREAAKAGLDVLHQNGIEQKHISVIAKGSDQELEELGRLRQGQDQGDSAKGAGVGAVIGGVLSLPLAASTLIGPFMVAGPLVGVGLGAAAGGLLSGAQQWGIDDSAATELENQVSQGKVLLILRSEHVDLDEVERILKTLGPESQTRFAEPERSASSSP